MAAWEPALVHTAGVGSRSGDESIAGKRHRRQRLRLAGRRLQESDLAALGGRRRETEGRAVIGGRDLFAPLQHLLAGARARPVQTFRPSDSAPAPPDTKGSLPDTPRPP